MGEPKDAAFASRWGSAAMETNLDLSVIIIYCVLFLKSWSRAGNIFF